MLITNEGIPLQTTVDSDTTVQVSPEIRLMMVITLNITPQYGGLVSQLSNKTRTVIKEMDKKNDLTCIRVQSTKFEVKFPSLKFGISTRCDVFRPKANCPRICFSPALVCPPRAFKCPSMYFGPFTEVRPYNMPNFS